GRRIYTIAEATRRRGRPAAAERPLSASGGTLSGTLPLVPFAGVARSVLAPLRVDGEPAFAAVSLDGARLEPAQLMDRSGYAHAHFEDTALGSSAVLATGEAAEALHERCDALATAFALIELAGMMQRILEMTTEYVSHRVQFGQPIAKFQAVRHRAAELLTQTETTRWAAYHALWRFQENPADTDEIWLTKHWAIRAVDRVYQVSHLLHGGVGVGMEYPLHLFTQGIAAFAARDGTMSEMVDRTVASVVLGA
ncbi:MAG: acyl-CoA dehydrogenase family protein, partial [Dehalococcoidia bacterium]|nr:acyl-CoA dehydrogenase family protein [Dehalococcoidia bacterium]